jgi:hypothetical protein
MGTLPIIVTAQVAYALDNFRDFKQNCQKARFMRDICPWRRMSSMNSGECTNRSNIDLPPLGSQFHCDASLKQVPGGSLF